MRSPTLAALLLVLSVASAAAQETLDLTVEPDDVRSDAARSGERAGPIDGPYAVPERIPGVTHPERGWSLRPEAEADLRTPGGDEAAGGSGLSDLEVELESLGLRLQRTW